MAKASAAAERPQSNVVTTGQAGPPAYLKDRMSQSTGRGVSTLAEDNQVPLIYVLDAKSPQVDANDPRYIPNAGAGDVWLRNYVNPIIKGRDGFLFQPCYFTKDWVEWVPRNRGGGFVGRHRERPAEAKQVPHPEQPKKTIWMLPNGNEVKETRYHAGFVHIDGARVPYVIPLSSTGHSVSRDWMFNMMNRRTDDGKIEDSFASLYRLKTKQRTNVSGKWYVLDPHWESYVPTAEDFDNGQKLHDAFASGEKMAAAEEQDQDASSSDGTM